MRTDFYWSVRQGIDPVPNVSGIVNTPGKPYPKYRVPVLILYRTYRIVGYRYRDRIELTEVWVTGTEFVPSFMGVFSTVLMPYRKSRILWFKVCTKQIPRCTLSRFPLFLGLNVFLYLYIFLIVGATSTKALAHSTCQDAYSGCAIKSLHFIMTGTTSTAVFPLDTIWFKPKAPNWVNHEFRMQ